MKYYDPLSSTVPDLMHGQYDDYDPAVYHDEDAEYDFNNDMDENNER